MSTSEVIAEPHSSFVYITVALTQCWWIDYFTVLRTHPPHVIDSNACTSGPYCNEAANRAHQHASCIGRTLLNLLANLTNWTLAKHRWTLPSSAGQVGTPYAVSQLLLGNNNVPLLADFGIQLRQGGSHAGKYGRHNSRDRRRAKVVLLGDCLCLA
jgi:hypothetical protein